MARIAVIGAGMGAMAAGARLAVAGHRVTVFERAETYGGALGRFERDGFAFDTGPGLLPLPAVYRDLFIKTGKQPLEECVELVQVDPAVRHVLADGTTVTLPNASRAGCVDAFEEALGQGAGERWSAFLNRAREAWDRTRRPLLEEPLWPNWEVLADRDPYPAVRRSGLLRRRPPTFAEAARRELVDPRLIAIVESSVRAYGLDPHTAPASAAVLPYMEQAFGTWYVRGGMRQLAQAVYERCLARKVEFRFGAEVTGIAEKDGRAAGIVLSDGTQEEADHVVAGVDPARLRSLTGDLVQGDVRVGPEAPVLPSRCTVLLALRGGPEEGAPHHTVVHLPGGRTVGVLRPGDPALRPDDAHDSMVLTTVVPAGDSSFPPLGDDRVREPADEMLSAAASAIPGLRERLLWREVRTPAHIEAATGATGGAVPAPALAGAGGQLLYPSNGTGLPGLYSVGGWSHPGGGLPHAGMSGALVAGLIVEGPGFRGSQ